MKSLEDKYCYIIIKYLKIYSKTLMYELADGILSSKDRIDEVLDLVNQNLPEEQMITVLKNIRIRDNIPYEDEYDYEEY